MTDAERELLLAVADWILLDPRYRVVDDDPTRARVAAALLEVNK